MADGHRFENRKITTCPDELKWISQGHWSSAILDF